MTNLYNVALGSKVAGGIDIDLDALTPQATSYLIRYGLKQALNDAHAAMKPSDKDYSSANVLAQVEKRLANIMAGTVKAMGTREASDPIGAEAKKIAAVWFKGLDDQKRKVGLTKVMSANGVDEKAAKSAIIDGYAKRPEIREAAERNIANRVVDVEIDIDDLFDTFDPDAIPEDVERDTPELRAADEVE